MDIAIIIGALVMFALFVWAEASTFKSSIKTLKEISQIHSDTVAQLADQYAAERSVLLDRIMARDLPEVKMAQAIDRGDGPRATSKGQNDKKLSDEAQLLFERGIPK
jgi:hypothetical protein